MVKLKRLICWFGCSQCLEKWYVFFILSHSKLSQISAGVSHGRRDHILKCDLEALHWLPLEPARPFWTDVPAPYPKRMRGFTNRKVARFILPVRWVPEFDTDPERYVVLNAEITLRVVLEFYS